MEIIEYKMGYSADYLDFIEIVNRMIKLGYQPYGNTFQSNELDDNIPCYHQPMVKYNTKKEPRWKTWKRQKRGRVEDIVKLTDIVLRPTKSC